MQKAYLLTLDLSKSVDSIRDRFYRTIEDLGWVKKDGLSTIWIIEVKYSTQEDLAASLERAAMRCSLKDEDIKMSIAALASPLNDIRIKPSSVPTLPVLIAA